MPKISVGEPFCAVFQKISGSEKGNGSERGGVSRFSVEIFLSDSAEKFRGWGESFSVSFISGIEKVWIRGGRQYQDFPSNFFCLTVPKEFVREPFRVSLISGMEKFFASEGYVTIFDFLSKFFCLTVPRIFVGEPLCAVFHKIFSSEKFMHRSGVEYQKIPSKTSCLTVPRYFVGKPLSVSLLSGAEENWIRKGVGSIKIFCRQFSVSSGENFRR